MGGRNLIILMFYNLDLKCVYEYVFVHGMKFISKTNSYNERLRFDFEKI